jgi:hypothetical protein
MRQFLIHTLGDAIIVVDTTGVGMKAKSVPSLQFTSWQDAEQFFLGQGAAGHFAGYRPNVGYPGERGIAVLIPSNPDDAAGCGFVQ